MLKQQSERARTPVVPRRSDVLKAPPLSSAFKTRRHNFAMDGKIMPAVVTTYEHLTPVRVNTLPT
ncbi:hypothetical protein FUT84_07570 [Treponema phagedenis]|uniref:Uncharacterized protein n=1 Tax=Treponema phagedenis TaxID=162 RepID=A0AAE6M8M0_TREPH|nr:hypothetical protein [Treponema phagedenis]QEJ96468.1 hypothetical protein FUT79_07725 [Treponema phagedenis]QEJ99628.1 hypothetical protein FUT82_09620 [Treponema phagedenis]QEK02251.1 hypothetical protein FUT84_07570 [Treponema phagedenis]QEK07840.1 hypothetical protein FUT80_04465 [Treponema phagedenis]